MDPQCRRYRPFPRRLGGRSRLEREPESGALLPLTARLAAGAGRLPAEADTVRDGRQPVFETCNEGPQSENSHQRESLRSDDEHSPANNIF